MREVSIRSTGTRIRRINGFLEDGLW